MEEAAEREGGRSDVNGGYIFSAFRPMSLNARPIPFGQVSVLVSYSEALMLDLIMVAAGLAFFALSIGYAVACDRL